MAWGIVFHLESRLFRCHEIITSVMKYLITAVIIFMTVIYHFMTVVMRYYIMYQIVFGVMNS